MKTMNEEIPDYITMREELQWAEEQLRKWDEKAADKTNTIFP